MSGVTDAVGHVRRRRCRRTGPARPAPPGCRARAPGGCRRRPSPSAVADPSALDQREVGGVGDQELASVWVRSRTSSSPRCVGLAPTTTAPARAAASSQKTNSGTLSSRTATWKGPSPGWPRSQAARCGRPGHHLGVAQAQVARHQAERSSSARARTARRWCRVAEAGAGSGAASGGTSAGVTASPNVSDLGWKPHYWNTLHFSPSRVTVAGAPAERTAATVRRGRATPWNSGSSTPRACCRGTSSSTVRRPSTTASWTRWRSSWRPTRPASSTPGPPSTTS